ncbi:valine--tRNA ligase [Pacificimonas sp. WHA3]|uniref:Valine--tRNA ligase n=1 Tax=Pacificimonas pallii TaxID=2827236 RepID=A0ABS6SDD4_9SPHN|nr:valine--tRNA ligase [Pacificimonas pallii]MBV7256424.1 valine--tRNA ligase [Pacificimonas pallii]
MTDREIPKTFDPADIESRWYAHWEESGAFRPDRPDAEPFTIVIPPPNVTGSLHMGHALDNTLQDVLIRYQRMRGRDALWVVGTDHAGIATQMVVERRLAADGVKRTDMMRAEFETKVWDWKEESGGTITTQLRRLGASCDWSNERFTMDDGLSKAVRKVFVDLYDKGLIYRDKRLVNWDPKFKTAISDLEVETREVNGRFWHMTYPLADGSGALSVATTRPETMLADMAVAVHPDDDRYRAMVGKMVKLPITGREIPIVTDEHADPELGSGAVKITPGHDFNDFDVGKRAGIVPADMLNMFDDEARIVQTSDGLIPNAYLGLSREDARKALVAELEETGALERVEDRTIQAPYGDRSGVVIEPWLTDQWYVDAETLAKPAMAAVRSGETKFVPATWEKTYFNWMENIQPWCISRQLWWGHQIPAWYDADGNVFVADDAEAAQRKAGEGAALTRDPDVLDTWFSSGLWPFSTLGWPDETAMLEKHYPTDVLVTGFDIIFFWVARMMMQGIEFTGKAPFHTVYCHGLVRAADGQKMSKSKGNTVDPLGIIDKYGADALRFTMTAMESQGRDIKLDERRIEGYRNFATKLWNAARFAQGYGIGASQTYAPPSATSAVNRWIIGETIRTAQALDGAIAEYRFDSFAGTAYHFAWDRFCDWYLELIKPVLQGEDEAAKEETKAVAGWVLDQILVMLHPVMPFITEELWHKMGPRPYDLIHAKWVAADAHHVEEDAAREVDWLIDLIGAIRSSRSELNVPAGAKLPLHVRDASAETAARLGRNTAMIERLARAEGISTAAAPEGGSAQIVLGEATYIIPLEGVIDLAAERARLTKNAEAAEKEIKSIEGRLGNPKFREKAKPEVVVETEEKLVERKAEAERLRAALTRLG